MMQEGHLLGRGTQWGAAKAGKGALGAFLSNPFVAIGLTLGLSWLSRLFRRDKTPVATVRAVTRNIRIVPAPSQTVIGEKGTRTKCVPVFDAQQPSIEGDPNSGTAWDYGVFVSNGYCLGLEVAPVIWVDGERIPLEEVSPTAAKHRNFPACPSNARCWTNRDDLRGRGSALSRSGRSIMVYEYISGGVWESLASVTRRFEREADRWPESRFVQGISGLHIRLWEQPLPANPWPSEQNKEFVEARKREWSARPVWPTTNNATFEVIFGGVKFSYPGQSEPKATSNAAAIRWWWLLNHRRVPPEKIDRKSVEDAISVCAEEIRYYTADDYLDEYGPGVEGIRHIPSKRYAMNGVIFGDDRADAVEDEMDFAWMGRVAREDGAYVFRPGRQREPIHYLDESMFSDDFPPVLQSGGFQNAICGGVRMTMAQSEFSESRLPTSSAPAMTHGEETLPGEVTDIGTRAFVSDPWQAARACELTRRILREQRRGIFTIPARHKLRLRSIRVGDPVSIRAPSIGAKGETWIITGRGVAPNKSMRLVAQPDIDWSEPAVAPALPRPSGGTGASPEVVDPTVEPGEEEPPSEN